MRYKHFRQDERYEISILLKKGYSARDIGYALGKHHSSVSREIKSNSVNRVYDPQKAQHKSYARRKYSKYQSMKIRENPRLERYIQEKIKSGWTPEEIAGRLKFKNEGKTIICFKSIYKYLNTPFGEAFQKYLPFKRKRRKLKGKKKREIIKNRIFIDERPEIINQRLRVGDFEGDTLGVPKASKATLAGVVDRKSRYFLAKKIARLKEAMTALNELLKPHNPFSLTLDNGPENTRYTLLKVPTFFCHPRAAWEKPTIENTFQRLRRYIPKKAYLTNYSEEKISDILDKMNNTPRKCLGFRTPKEVFFQKQPIQLQIPNLKCCTSG